MTRTDLLAGIAIGALVGCLLGFPTQLTPNRLAIET